MDAIYVVQDPAPYGNSVKTRYYRTLNTFVSAIVKGQGAVGGYHFTPKVPGLVFGTAQAVFADERVSMDLTPVVNNVRNNIVNGVRTKGDRKELAAAEKKAKSELEKALKDLGF